MRTSTRMVVLGGFKGVLDLISVRASAAYGLRRLYGSWTGAAIRVRRSSDNAEIDIGFTSTGELNTISLLNHVGYENLLVRSEEVNQSPWALSNGSASNPVITANFASAPDGTMTADRVQLNKTGGLYSRVMQSTVQPPKTYTYSVYLKNNSAGVANVGIRIHDRGVNCVVTQDWQRFSVTRANITTPDVQILLFDEIVDNDEIADILVWGNQLNTGATPKPYQKTVATANTGNGFVTTWYDQSGNGRNATQTTAERQPQIVGNDALEALNGKPEIRFDGVNDYLAAPSPLIDTKHSLFILFTPTIKSQTGSVFGQWGSNQNGRFTILVNQISTGEAYAGFLNAFNSSATEGGGYGGLMKDVAISNTPTLITLISTTGSEQWKLFKNGAEWDSATITNVFTGVNSAIGSLNGTESLFPFEGTVSELILFPSALSTADRQTLERNEGTYYSITVA
jgi:hypothetical protein